jgi:hypothetical protein
MAETRRRNDENKTQTHAREPHERDYEREDKFQKNPQGRLSKASAPATKPASRRPPAGGTASRRSR